jgi:hypothetical protein
LQLEYLFSPVKLYLLSDTIVKSFKQAIYTFDNRK